MKNRPAREALRRFADSDPEQFDLFAVHIAHFEGWSCFHSKEKSRKRLLRIINSGGRPGHTTRNIDVDWALIAVDFLPNDEITPLFVRRSARAEILREQEAEARAAPPKMAKVDRARDRKRGAA